MDEYQQLKTEFEELSALVSEYLGSDCEEQLRLYILSAWMKIWAANGLYAPVYAKAVAALTGSEPPLVQMLTALSCCGETSRELAVPPFYKELVKKENEQYIDGPDFDPDVLPGQTADSVTVQCLQKIYTLLVDGACINGDFTFKEALTIERIILVKLCGEAMFEGVFPDESVYQNIADKATPLNTAAYLQPGALAGLGLLEPTPAPEAQEETPADPAPVAYGEDTAQASPPPPPQSVETLESLLAELDSLVGLQNVKQDVHSLMNFIKVAKLREARGMKVPTISYHLVFTGNPGTGKTTVARLVAKLYYQMGILPQGQLVEADRSALVAGYVGQTAIKTQEVIQKALGGVLFIDEAYALANGNDQDSYGQEAIETLLKAMEDHRDELVVIVAGYDALMHRFINANPGLSSRFSKYFQFPDYTGEELLRIFRRFCETNGYTLPAQAEQMLLSRFTQLYEQRQEHFGNARTIRNIFEKAINCQADRIAHRQSITDAELMQLEDEDLQNAMKGV